jgi:hypothetical protein
MQAPATQVSVWVHWLPSSQVEPSALAVLEQTPVETSHALEWH